MKKGGRRKTKPKQSNSPREDFLRQLSEAGNMLKDPGSYLTPTRVPAFNPRFTSFPNWLLRCAGARRRKNQGMQFEMQ